VVDLSAIRRHAPAIHLYRDHRDGLSASFGAFIEYGRQLPEQVYRDAVARAAAARASIGAAFGDRGALLAPSALGEAPVGLQSTGNPVSSIPVAAAACRVLALADGARFPGADRERTARGES
jgi:hypothetical protein